MEKRKKTKEERSKEWASATDPLSIPRCLGYCLYPGLYFSEDMRKRKFDVQSKI